MSRTEALSYREQCLKFRVRRGVDHLLDIVREVESEIESFHAMLDASVIVGQLGDVRISEGDQFLRNLPNKVQEFLQLHQNATIIISELGSKVILELCMLHSLCKGQQI